MMKKYLLLIIVFFGLKNTLIAQEVIEVVEDTEEVEETILESTEDDSNVNSIYTSNNSTDIVTGEIENTLLIFKGKNSDKYGLKNKNNKVLVKPIFSSINSYSSTKNRIIASLNWSKKGVIDQNGNIIVPFKYSDISKRQNLFIVSADNQKTVFDYYGNMIINEGFEDFYTIDNNYFKIKRNGFYGILTPLGKELIPAEYDEISYNSNKDWFILKQNDNSFIQTSTGKSVFGKEFSSLKKLDYSFNIIKANKNGKYGIINSQKEILVPFKFQDIQNEYYQNTFIVKLKGKWGLYNTLVKDFIKKPEFDEIKRISDHLYKFTTKNQKLLINLVSNKKSDITNYDKTSNYLNYDLITVEKNSLSGVLNAKTGKLIIPTKYSYNDILRHVIKSKIPNSNTFDIYDHQGNNILNKISNTRFLDNNKITFNSKGKVGLLDRNKIVLPLEYSYIVSYDYFPVLLVKKDNKYALLNNYDYSYLIKPSDSKIIVDKSNKTITHKNKKYTLALGSLIEIKK